MKRVESSPFALRVDSCAVSSEIISEGYTVTSAHRITAEMHVSLVSIKK